MEKKALSVIIPYYKETAKDMLPLLSSIYAQTGIDFNRLECLLVNDGVNNALSGDFLDMFSKLNIRTVFMPKNKGPGVARQVGIDNAAGEYIMFCDADDILHSAGVLGAFLQEIDRNKPDMITTPWLEEIFNEHINSFVYITHDNEMTWMHGKVFRRLFLIAEDIMFHDELRVHEDSYFLAVADVSTSNKRKLLVTSYVWKWSPNSITRKNDGVYTYTSMATFLEAVGLSFREVEPRAPESMVYKTVQLIMYIYFNVHQPHWLASDKEGYLSQTEKAFAVMIKPYMHYFHDAPYDLICRVYSEERAKIPNAAIENENLRDWLKRVGAAEPS